MTVSDAAGATARIHDPATYVQGPPLAELARLRRERGVVWVDEPDGPGTGWCCGMRTWNGC